MHAAGSTNQRPVADARTPTDPFIGDSDHEGVTSRVQFLEIHCSEKNFSLSVIGICYV